MLRSRSVSSRSVLRSVVSVTLVVLSLFLASPASAATAVVVTGPEGSARVTAIVSELRSRGFDVVTEDAPQTATVRVAPDGSVLVLAGDRRETFASSESDAILARRVAETIRAAEPEPPPPPPPPSPSPSPSPPPSPSPSPSPPRSRPPSRTFALSGTWLLSVDDALPLLAVGGGASPLSTERVLRIGDPTFATRTSPKPMSLDVAVADRWTVGGTVLFQAGGPESVIGASLRTGYVLPLTDRLALWPRVGVAHASSLGGDWGLTSRTDVVADVRLVWMVSNAWALTLGPTVALAVQSHAREEDRNQLAFACPGSPCATGVSYPTSAAPRIGVAIGITGRIKDGSDEQIAAHGPEPRVFLGIERALPLFRMRLETTGEAADTGPAGRADTGTADVTSITPQAPRFSVDVRVGEKLTVGMAGSVGYVRTSVIASSLVPRSTAPDVLAWTVAPRVGWRTPLSSTFAFWPRLGIAYANASASRERNDDVHGRDSASNYHLGVDVDAFGVFSPIEGVGFVFGPSIELPIVGVRHITTTGLSETGNVTTTTKRHESAVITAALTGGLVVAFP